MAPGQRNINLRYVSEADMFTVAFDPARHLVQATLEGFLDPAEVARYAATVEPVVRRAARAPTGYVILLDLSGCAIQTQEVVAAFQKHVGGVPAARRCAIVTGSSAIRMQVRRVAHGPSRRVFADRAAALDWLTDAGAARPCAAATIA